MTFLNENSVVFFLTGLGILLEPAQSRNPGIWNSFSLAPLYFSLRVKDSVGSGV